MNVTILFGDRAKKSSVDQISQRAREVVESALARIRSGQPSAADACPVWHSVAMQIDCREEAEFRLLLQGIERNCAHRQIAVMGIRCA